jgi:hypothetical protein
MSIFIFCILRGLTSVIQKPDMEKLDQQMEIIKKKLLKAIHL